MVEVLNELFVNPLVTQVAFEIKFPDLFYIESKIGDFQVNILEKFPKSSLAYRKQIVFANLGPNAKREEIDSQIDNASSSKVWQFTSEDAQIEITSNSLVVMSQKIKKYSSVDGFREVAHFVVDKFFEIATIPTINRIGLRYINECPISTLTDTDFRSKYNSVLPITRFSIADTSEALYRTVVKQRDLHLIYLESLVKKDNNHYLLLDLDSFLNNIPSVNYLNKIDELHEAVRVQFFKTLKQPIIELMRRRP